MSGLTKIFIVLQLVFSLVVAVLLVLMVSKLEPYKSLVDQANAGKLGAMSALGAALEDNAAKDATLNKTRSDLQAALAESQRVGTENQAKIAGLTQSLQAAEVKASQAQTQLVSLTNAIATLKDLLAEKDRTLGETTPKVAQLTTQYNEVYRTNNELQNQLRGAEQTIRKLQEQIANLPSGGGAAGGATASAGDSNAQVASLSAASGQGKGPINARITEVKASATGRTLIALPLGARDGLKENTRLAIYRGNTYLGDAVIQTVTPDQSAATVVGPVKEPIQIGDLVMTVQ